MKKITLFVRILLSCYIKYREIRIHALLRLQFEKEKILFAIDLDLWCWTRALTNCVSANCHWSNWCSTRVHHHHHWQLLSSAEQKISTLVNLRRGKYTWGSSSWDCSCSSCYKTFFGGNLDFPKIMKLDKVTMRLFLSKTCLYKCLLGLKCPILVALVCVEIQI